MTEVPSTFTNCASCCPRRGKLGFSLGSVRVFKMRHLNRLWSIKLLLGYATNAFFSIDPAIAALKLLFAFHVFSQFHTVC